MNRPVVFDLLRHGLTGWNLERRMQGQSDTGLTDKGREDAGQWADRLEGSAYDILLRSDLKRAVQTADIINERLRLPVVEDVRLREQDWGDWTGRTVSELNDACGNDLLEQESKGWDFMPPGGESRGQVRDRALKCFRDMAANGNCRKILVVAHLGVIKGLVFQALGGAWLEGEAKPFKNRLLQRLLYEEGCLAVLALNEKR